MTINLPDDRDLRVIVRDGGEYTPEAIESCGEGRGVSGQVLSLVDAARLEQLITEDISDAVAAERERCAKIAEAIIEDCLRSPGSRPELYDESLMVEQIAAKIRSGE